MTVESILEGLAELAHDAALRDGDWQELLGRLGQELRADGVGLFRHDLASGAGMIEEAAGIAPDFRLNYAALQGPRNPWFRDQAQLLPGVAVLGAELAPVWELVRSDLYRSWLRPQGALHALIGVIAREGLELRGLIALRSHQAGEFGRRERAIVAGLAPALRRALGFAARLRQEVRQSRILIELLNRVPEAILLIDRDSRVHLHNCAAGELLARGDGLHRVGGRLCGTDPQESRRLHELVAAKAGCAGTSGEMLITRTLSRGGPLLVTVSSVGAAAVEGELPLAAVSTRDRTQSSCLSVPRLRRLLPLTPTEARFAALILHGHGLLDVAAMLHISKNTARTHMKHIYAKTDLHRQPDLQRLLDSSVYDPEPALPSQQVQRHPRR